jgi:nicotinic acid phosphoribosyltransferase
MTNLILATDSYKHSHFLQYPPEARAISAYVERGPMTSRTKCCSWACSPS